MDKNSFIAFSNEFANISILVCICIGILGGFYYTIRNWKNKKIETLFEVFVLPPFIGGILGGILAALLGNNKITIALLAVIAFFWGLTKLRNRSLRK